METLVCAVRKFDGEPDLSDLNPNETIIRFHHQRIRFNILCTADAKKAASGSGPECHSRDFESLSLVLQRASDPKHHHTWHDIDGHKLEDQLTQIATEIIVLAEIQQRTTAQLRFELLSDQLGGRRRHAFQEEAKRRTASHERKEQFQTARLEMMLGHARDIEHARR